MFLSNVLVNGLSQIHLKSSGAFNSDMKTILSFGQMTESEKKEAAWILNDLLINTDLKKYRGAISCYAGRAESDP